jgi:hypothetical protein
VSPRLSAGLAVLAAVAVAGCGGSKSQRGAVAAYVTHVNQIESALAKPLDQVTRAGSSFASELHAGPVTEGPIVNNAEQTLQTALSEIRRAQLRLSALPAPAPASHLRALVVELAAGEAGMTHEVAVLVAYLPRFDAALARLGPAALALQHVLSQNATGASAVAAVYAAKGAALRRFQAAVGEVVAHLHKLKPPAVSSPGYKAQLKSLREMGASAGQLAGALSSGSLGVVPHLLVEFDRAATLSRSQAVQRAQIAAVREYNRQSARLTKLQAKIAQERLRLDNYLK